MRCGEAKRGEEGRERGEGAGEENAKRCLASMQEEGLLMQRERGGERW